MPVLLCNDIDLSHLQSLLQRYGMELKRTADCKDIPGSFWQPPEAGLVGNTLHVRGDTPVHSALHEACHYICMDDTRRRALDTDAGGDFEEENGVCYLQVLLADQLQDMGRDRMFADMDAWGYSFRLGSSRAWFEHDAEDAAAWLLHHGLTNDRGHPSWKFRK